jgi:hypothetical protein
MKKFVFLTLITLMGATSFCQTSSLDEAITISLSLLDSAKTINDVQTVANQLQRITIAEPNRWEPFYHLAYVQITMSFWEKDGETKDKILDQAEINISKALELNGDKSELHTLQAFLYQGRIQVNGSRGMVYSMRAKEMLDQAISENAENPRAFFLMAQNIYYTPKAFGGGGENALPVFVAAKEKFEKEQGKSGIGPKWGATSNTAAIEQCNNEK